MINNTADEPVSPSAKSLSKVDDRADIIYQKDASFSAVLDTRKVSFAANDSNDSEAVSFVTSSTAPGVNFERKVFLENAAGAARTTTTAVTVKSSTESFRLNDPSCVKSCGPTGTCILEVSESDDSSSANQRCQCVLGKTGSNCQTGKNEMFFAFGIQI